MKGGRWSRRVKKTDIEELENAEHARDIYAKRPPYENVLPYVSKTCTQLVNHLITQTPKI